MHILMMTNTYAPVIGGIEKSIHSFSEEFRKHGHQVVIVAPTFEGMNENEKDVIRIPAIQNFLKEDVSFTLPTPIFLNNFMKEFQPDIIHSHQFFWVGDMALRLARQYHVPLVYTHHIMLNQYSDFLPIHNEGVKRFVIKLATGYANLTDRVIAPSQVVSDMLDQDGVTKPIHIIPTGVDVIRFAKGDGKSFRKAWNIPEDAFVIGCVCRLNPEKNLEFLARAACQFLKRNHKAHCLIVGDGSLKEKIKEISREFGVDNRLHCTGTLQNQALVDSYYAMDAFIFTSHSETQGLVLLESMACGTPVVALNDPVIGEVIKDRKNGLLVLNEDEDEFVLGLSRFAELSKNELQKVKDASRATAAKLSLEQCAKRLLDIYEDLRNKNATSEKKNNVWDAFKDGLAIEKDLLKNAIEATEAALKKD